MSLLSKGNRYEIKRGIISEATDYNVYFPSIKEKVLWALCGLVAGGVVLYIFYEMWVISVVAGIACGVAFVPIRTRQLIKKRKEQLTQQFKALLESLSASIGAGRNIMDSFAAAGYDLTVQYGPQADIVRECQIICEGFSNNIQVEDLLFNFAERSGIDDVKNFADVFATCYKKGGNIKEVIRNTTTIISDKIEIQMELQTMVAGQKNEQNIMLVMPIGFVFIMKSMGGSLVDLSSANGLLAVTIAMIIFVAAYIISGKILDIKI